MGMIRNINAWKTKTAKMKEKIKTSASSYVQRQVMTVLKDALKVSPQWSGDYAYNWVIEFKGQQGAYDPRFKVQDWHSIVPRQAGDTRAISQALAYAEAIKDRIKWNSLVTLRNYSPTAELLDSGEVRLRPENLIAAPQGVVAYLNVKYKYLGKL